MSWESIAGQQRVKKILMSSIGSGRIPHAYLFYGPRGVGKDAIAIELAKVANCERGEVEACDRCDNCTKIHSLQHPNLTLVFALPAGKGEKAGDPPLAKLSTEDLENVREQVRLKAADAYHTVAVPKATTIKVNSIRSLKREAALTAFSTGRKVIVIIDAEMMNEESANALLKTLEEPTDNTLLILTTSHKDRLAPTVVSRCQAVRFDFLAEPEIEQYLIRAHGVEQARASLLARLAHGSISLARGLMTVDIQEQREKALDFLRKVYSGNAAEIVNFVEDLARSYDRTELERFLQVSQFWIRDALCLQQGHDRIINADQKETVERFSRKFAHMNFEALLTELDRAISLIAKNAYIPLILTVLSLNIRRHMKEA